MEGCVILERKVIMPPNPVERRLGIYDYLVEVPPAPEKPVKGSRPRETRKPAMSAPSEGFTRATPDEHGGGLIRRMPQR